MATADRTALNATGPEPVSLGRRRGWWNREWAVEHRPFLISLALGCVIRAIVQVAFSPALIHSDGPLYLAFIKTLTPGPNHPVGYPLLVLVPLSWITKNVVLVAFTQHIIGLATAIVLYALLRHWGVRRWPATLAVLPVLFDTLELILEQTVLSDTLFDLVLLGAIGVLCWNRRPNVWLALTAGLLIAVSVLVRLVAEPLVLVGIAYCLLVGGDWRRRVAGAVALTVGFMVPIAGYATWYHHDHGVYALTQYTGKSLYTRVSTFVICQRITVPPYQRVLCPRVAPDKRLDPTYYVWHDPNTLPKLKHPHHTTPEESMKQFAVAAIRGQPLAYARDVTRDFLLNFDYWRGDRFQYDTAHKWRFSTYLDPRPTRWTRPAYAQHGGKQLVAVQPYAGFLAGYQWVGYLPGPLLFACLVLGLLGGLGVGKARGSGMRSKCLLLTITGAVLMLVPDLTAEFVWRYQLPALMLLPAAAALAYTAMRGQRSGPATVVSAVPDDGGDRED